MKKIYTLYTTLFITACLSCMFQHTQAQRPYFKHYTEADGLSYNSVICGLQDSKGFLWFGTKDGLNRFDGYSFKIFRHRPGDSMGIGNNYITALHEDNKGILWVGTVKGLYEYSADIERFRPLEAALNKNIRDIQSDGRGNIWYIANTTLCRYNQRSGQIKEFRPRNYFPATSICKGDGDILWIATSRGNIERYNPQTGSFTRFKIFNKATKGKKWIGELSYAGNQSLLIGTPDHGALLFDIRTGSLRNLPLYSKDKKPAFIRDFMRYAPNEYWIATESGIFIYNIRTGAVKHLLKNKDNPYTISDNAVYTLFKDKEGGVWAGTYFGGLNYTTNSPLLFEKYFPTHDPHSISGSIVREICRDQYGNFWIGTEDAGLNKFDPQTGIFTHFRATGHKGDICYSNIHALLPVGNELWIGTYAHGLDVMDIPSGKVIRHYNAGPGKHSFKSNFIVTACRTREGDILLGTWTGLYQYNKKSDDFTRIQYVPAVHIYAILEDEKGTMWICSKGRGVFYYNKKTGDKGHFSYDPNIKNSLSSNIVNHVTEDSRGHLWFATEEGGVCEWTGKGNHFKRYTVENGLPSNFIFKILEDNRHTLWISTSKGLANLDPQQGRIKVYTKDNGLPTNQFNYNSGYKDTKGSLYFGTISGMIDFNPIQLQPTDYTPPVYITGFQINDKELAVNKDHSPLKKSLIYTHKITLAHKDATFNISFAALTYTAPEMTKYAYKMAGLNDEWTYLKTNRKAYFTKLPSGYYTFMVKAANSSGIWNGRPAALKIHILPPFYASNWACLVYAILAITLVWLVVRNYHRRTEKRHRRNIELLENEKEKEIYQAKIEFFTHITHEIRTPLTLIQAPLEKLKYSNTISEVRSHAEMMEKNTGRLLKLINQLLDFRKTETNMYRLNFIKTNISALLKDNCIRFRETAAQKNIIFHTLLPPQPVYACADPEALNKIISNLLNNALKYAHRYVETELKPAGGKDTTFTIKVKNDGYLIPADMKENIFEPFFRINKTNKEQGTGIGLPLARSLAVLHKGTLELMQSGSMNVFLLTLPLRQEKEFNLEEDAYQAGNEKPGYAIKEHDESKPAILLVEDNREILQFIVNELSTRYRIHTANNGAEALAVLEDNLIQIMVSDVMMPVMDGFELCRSVKTNLKYSHIPVILLTAKNTLHSKIAGLELGADAYIEKPFSPRHLEVQLSNLLDNRNKVKEYFAKSSVAHIQSIAYSKEDEKFLDTLVEVINNNMDNQDLNTDLLARELFMSRTTLFRKIKGISNLTPNELINITRLKKAAELLAKGKYKIYEIANMTGFSSQSNFTRAFQKQFGISPSAYASSRQPTKKKNIEDILQNRRVGHQ